MGCGVRSRVLGQLIQPKPVISWVDEQSGYVVAMIAGSIERQGFLPERRAILRWSQLADSPSACSLKWAV